MRKLLCVLTLVFTVILSVLVLSTPSNAGPSKKQSATSIALAQVGDSYVYGATGPNSFDCSGLVQYAFSRAGYRNVPRTAHAQYLHSRPVSRSAMRRGDLFFYHNSAGHVYHVAIYLGHRRMVEAANPGAGVRSGPTWQAPRYRGTLRK